MTRATRVHRKLPRERPAEQLALLQPRAVQIGRLIFEWAALHTELFGMFWLFVGDGGKPPRSLATDLWISAPSDTAQRRMLGTFATHHLVGDRANRDRVNWLLRAIDELSTYRNIAAHLAMEFDERAGRPRMAIAIDGVRRAAALRNVFTEWDNPSFWPNVVCDVYALAQYANLLTTHIFAKNLRGPLPYRPRLLSLPAIEAANKTIGLLSRPKRQRRQSASRAKL